MISGVLSESFYCEAVKLNDLHNIFSYITL